MSASNEPVVSGFLTAEMAAECRRVLGVRLPGIDTAVEPTPVEPELVP